MSAPDRPSLSLLTDLYQLSMAAAAWKSGAHRKEGVFHLHFRRAPFQGGFTIAAGLSAALAHLRSFHFDEGANRMTVTAVHPDSASLQLHMEVGREEFRKLGRMLTLTAVEGVCCTTRTPKPGRRRRPRTPHCD